MGGLVWRESARVHCSINNLVNYDDDEYMRINCISISLCGTTTSTFATNPAGLSVICISILCLWYWYWFEWAKGDSQQQQHPRVSGGSSLQRRICFDCILIVDNGEWWRPSGQLYEEVWICVIAEWGAGQRADPNVYQLALIMCSAMCICWRQNRRRPPI